MSYILDALKRAESERSRGAVPNLHAQPGLSGDGDAGGSVALLRAALAVALAVLLLAAVAWWWMSGEGAQPPAATADAMPSMSPPAVLVAPPAAAPIVPPAASPITPSATVSSKPVPLPWMAQKAAPLPVAPPARAEAAAASASERVYTLKELPDNIRSSLPVLTVGGATYSDNAASRMLIVNGNLFHEGDKLTPELTLRQIKLRAAVLSFRGYRYSISY